LGRALFEIRAIRRDHEKVSTANEDIRGFFHSRLILAAGHSLLAGKSLVYYFRGGRNQMNGFPSEDGKVLPAKRRFFAGYTSCRGHICERTIVQPGQGGLARAGLGGGGNLFPSLERGLGAG